ncbi:MAG: bifunctional homocysteine S-methyltransferase/methylenetetrahydrofolate reductase [Myxococcota bacterium]
MKELFLEAITRGGLIGDGAMGSLLYERGVFPHRSFDESAVQQPELVYKIHHDYLLAGAQVLETNSYGANRLRLSRHGLGDEVERINRAAVRIAREASEQAAYVVGSIGPTGLSAGDVRRSERAVRDAYREQAKILADAGCDALILETFASPAELRLAVESAREVSSLPIVALIKPNDGGEIADGSDPRELAQEMQSWGANVVGANCSAPAAIYEVTAKMVESGLPTIAIPNAGKPESIEDRFIYLATPENFGVYARRMYKAGVKMVGGCCGTGPQHIHRVAGAARMVSPRQHGAAVSVEFHDRSREPAPLATRSRLGATLGQRFVVSVEVNPGTSLDLAPQVEAARMLVAAGADVINIADGPRATARIGNIALAVRLRTELDAEVLLHVCTRDRNLLGLQAHVLGAHTLGLRNLLIVTGDPPKVGDYPDAMAVYDLDSIGLLRLVDGFNRGLDPAGKGTAEQTAFVLATGVEPAAADFERELLRLRQKVEAGANLVLTQPVYDPTHLDRLLDATKELAVPVWVGLLPLASARNAEFLHHNVPGMQIPDETRRRMQGAGTGAGARREGVAIALETLQTVRHRVAGAYIMPPLGHYEMAAEILAQLGDRQLTASRS